MTPRGSPSSGIINRQSKILSLASSGQFGSQRVKNGHQVFCFFVFGVEGEGEGQGGGVAYPQEFMVLKKVRIRRVAREGEG